MYGHVADRTGLIHQVPVQLVPIETDDAAQRRTEQQARPLFLMHLHVHGELLRALERQERTTHRALRTDERQYRAVVHISLAAPFECQGQLRRQDRHVGGRKQTHPGRRQRLAVDFGRDLAALGKSGAQEHETLNLGHPVDSCDGGGQPIAAGNPASLVDRQVPRNA